MLRVEGLRVDYGPTSAVQDVSLTVGDGETVGLVGPNGAGKTTTLRAIVGLVRPVRGSVALEGESLAGHSADAVARRGVSLVPSGHRVFGSMSVRDNLVLGATATGGRLEDDALEAVLAHFPILRRHFLTAAGRMSGGEQQQLAIARALLAKPRLLLLDEPSQGLAPQFVELVFSILGQLREEGTTMLLVEQSVARTVAFCDRTYVMRSGRIAISGSRAELAKDDDLITAYLGG